MSHDELVQACDGVMNVPLVMFDHFYKDPDKIREYALSLDYIDDGHFPGTRTMPINELDQGLFEQMSMKFLSLVTDVTTGFSGSILTQFQKIPSISNPKLDRGLVHNDTGCFCAGLVYLNPEPNPNSGTSLYRLIPDEFEENCSYEDHNAQFEATVEIKNVYNRCIVYDAMEWHGHTSRYQEGEDRLTQVFFVQTFGVNERITSKRCHSYEI
tara:strand:- start:64 stop:699 length:636 start_codon:yes stop_codon:yes gene_type:complete